MKMLDLNGLKSVTLRIDGVTLTNEQLQVAWPIWQQYLDERILRSKAIKNIRIELRKKGMPMDLETEEEVAA